MYSRRATVSPNSIHVCPRRNALSDSDNSVPVNVGITFDPAFSGRWGYKCASCICWWERKCLTWEMGYGATETNKRISYGGEENNVCTERIALHIATDVWKHAGLAESMYQKARIYYYLPRGTVRCPVPIYTARKHRLSLQSQILRQISMQLFPRTKFTFLIFNMT